jgi:hypothetical protein
MNMELLVSHFGILLMSSTDISFLLFIFIFQCILHTFHQWFELIRYQLQQEYSFSDEFQAQHGTKL